MEHVVVRSKGSEEQLVLPPGFRFHPTDEELITHYLSKKVLDANFNAMAIGEVDLNKCEPWDLPWCAKMAGEKEWYFFCVRDKKYPTGLRTNRATEAGYWKATGKDKDVHRRNILVGMKKSLVFYRGRAPKGEKTDWVMHEYSISNLPKTAKNEWVICRVFKKSSSSGKQTMTGTMKMEMGYSSSYSDELGVNDSLLPPLMHVHNYANQASNPAVAVAHVTCFSNTKEQEECSKTMKNMPDQSSNPVKNMNDHQDYINGSLMQLLQGNVSYSVITKEEQVVEIEDQMVSKISQEMGFTNDDMNPEISSVSARVVPSTSSAVLHRQDCLWGC